MRRFLNRIRCLFFEHEPNAHVFPPSKDAPKGRAYLAMFMWNGEPKLVMKQCKRCEAVYVETLH